MGLRASATVTSRPNRLNVLTKTPIGANEPKSIMVPAQSNTTALNLLIWKTPSRTQACHHFLAERKSSRGAGAAGHHGYPDIFFWCVGPHHLGFRRDVAAGPALRNRPAAEVEHSVHLRKDQRVEFVRGERRRGIA